VLGFLLESVRVPLGPVVLGIILGGELEHKFIQCVTKSEGALAFLASPICVILAACCGILWLAPTVMRLLRRRRNVGQPPAEDT